MKFRRLSVMLSGVSKGILPAAEHVSRDDGQSGRWTLSVDCPSGQSENSQLCLTGKHSDDQMLSPRTTIIIGR